MKRHLLLAGFLFLTLWGVSSAQEFKKQELVCPVYLAEDPVRCKAYLRWLKTIPGYKSYFAADSEDAKAISQQQNKRSGPTKNTQSLDYPKMQSLVKYGTRPTSPGPAPSSQSQEK